MSDALHVSAKTFGTKSNEEKGREEQEALAKKRAEYANPRQGKENTEKGNERGSPIQHVPELGLNDFSRGIIPRSAAPLDHFCLSL
jgi:hypothetical protein